MVKKNADPALRGEIDRQLWQEGYFVAGVDEVGRGCLAGPVVAGAVILDPGRFSELEVAQLKLLRDSKTLSARQRQQAESIVKSIALSYATVAVPATDIETLGILGATFTAMKGAISKLTHTVDYVLVDGSQKIPQIAYPQKAIVKGDYYSYAIAAASIVAKNFRDAFMIACEEQYPGYGFKNNVGYGTQEHIRSIESLGITPLHRRNFAPIKHMLNEQVP